LIAKAKRQANGYRKYLPQTVQMLEIISTPQAGGFSLNEIRHPLPAPGMANRNKQALLVTLKQKVVEFELLQGQGIPFARKGQ